MFHWGIRSFTRMAGALKCNHWCYYTREIFILFIFWNEIINILWLWCSLWRELHSCSTVDHYCNYLKNFSWSLNLVCYNCMSLVILDIFPFSSLIVAKWILTRKCPPPPRAAEPASGKEFMLCLHGSIW